MTSGVSVAVFSRVLSLGPSTYLDARCPHGGDRLLDAFARGVTDL